MGLVRISESAVVDPGFSPGGTIPKWGCEPIFLAENCMKMKEFWKGGRVPGALLRSATEVFWCVEVGLFTENYRKLCRVN